jgi:hypothetical protein
MQYENRLVLFIDILGFRQIIQRTCSKNVGQNKQLIQNIFNAFNNYSTFFSDEGINDELFKSKKITQFSDTIVVSFILKDPGDILFTLSNCLHLIMSLIWRGFLCRGGIAYGKLIHTDKLIFGPALVEAYDLEEKAALYPRVVISESVLVKAFREYEKIPEVKGVDLYYGVEQIQDFLVKDLDGLFFIDYIRKVQGEIDEEKMREYYSRLKALIDVGMKSQAEHLKVKYGWMKEKYNEFVGNAKSEKTKKGLKQHPVENAHLIEFCRKLRYIK